jgi:hypothetical protein
MTDPEDLPWEELGPGIAQKLLYTQPTDGARTLLLRSRPRPKAQLGDLKPQYHPFYEEFLTLEGRFTLEGTHWLTPLTYVFYPAGLVHGFAVDVPDGYEIYLRNPGPFSFETVDAPARDAPYLIDDPEQETPGIIIADCGGLIEKASASGELSVIALRDINGDGAVIAALSGGDELQLPLTDPAAYAEIFVLEGEVGLPDGERLARRNHALFAGPDPLQIRGTEPAVVMLNYHGQRLMDQIASQAASLHRASNAYP